MHACAIPQSRHAGMDRFGAAVALDGVMDLTRLRLLPAVSLVVLATLGLGMADVARAQDPGGTEAPVTVNVSVEVSAPATPPTPPTPPTPAPTGAVPDPATAAPATAPATASAGPDAAAQATPVNVSVTVVVNSPGASVGGSSQANVAATGGTRAPVRPAAPTAPQAPAAPSTPATPPNPPNPPTPIAPAPPPPPPPDIAAVAGDPHATDASVGGVAAGSHLPGRRHRHRPAAPAVRPPLALARATTTRAVAAASATSWTRPVAAPKTSRAHRAHPARARPPHEPRSTPPHGPPPPEPPAAPASAGAGGFSGSPGGAPTVTFVLLAALLLAGSAEPYELLAGLRRRTLAGVGGRLERPG